MEPRARAGRHKNSLNFGPELSALLFATGAPTHPDILSPMQQSPNLDSSQRYLSNLPTPNTDHPPTAFHQPYPETLRVLDEMLTDFIIETCHSAVSIASYSGRTKLKLADFEWVLRKDAMKLGRVQEMFKKKRDIENQKKLFNEEMDSGKMAVGDMINLGEVAGEEGTGKGKGRGRGRRKKRGIDEVNGVAVGVGGGGKKSAAEGAGGVDEDGDFDVDLDDELDGVERSSKRAKSEVG